MVSRTTNAQRPAVTSTPQRTTTPARPATTQQPAPAQTQRAWGTGNRPAAPSQLRMASASIGEGRSVRGFPAPRGFKLETTTNAQTEKVKLSNGKEVSFEYSADSLTARGPNGKTINLVPRNDADFNTLRNDFRTEMASADPEYSNGWDQQTGFTGRGTAGQMVSVTRGSSEYMGGAHPNNSTQIETYDLRTGQRAQLDKLLTPAQFKGLCDAIEKKLPTLKSKDGEDIGPESFTPSSRAELEDRVKNNFALVTDKNGKVQIDVSWESGVHALGPYLANFTFDAPTTPAFKAAIGAN